MGASLNCFIEIGFIEVRTVQIIFRGDETTLLPDSTKLIEYPLNDLRDQKTIHETKPN
jgi:hypothetical protein